MRILMITDFYQPFVGGVEQHVRSLSHELVARGHEVAVATLWHDGLTQFEHDGAVRVHRLHTMTQRATWLFKNPGRPWAAPFPDPEAVVALRRIIGREQPDVVHGHDWLARSFVPLKVWSRLPLVMSLHYYTLSCAKKNLMYHAAPCSGPGLGKCLACASDHYGPGKGVPITLGNFALAAAERHAVDMFIPVSHATADGNGLRNSGLPVEVIPNFIPNRANIAPDDLHSYLLQLPPEPFLLYVGDLRRDKGLDVLLAAYRKLVDVPPLVLIGKVWPETPATFPANVHVLKNWPNYAVMAAWQRSLAGIVPSIWPEPFGIVVIEAMTSGKPVIGTRIGGIPDMVMDGETGLLVPPDDPAALRQAIRRLVDDAALRRRLGEAAQRKAAEFGADAVVPRIEQVYRRLVKARRHAEHTPPTTQPTVTTDESLGSSRS